MGQKTSPIGFRTGITLGWQSTWFAPKGNYGDFLVEDQKIRRYVDERFNRQMPKGAVAKVEIIRTRNEVNVTMHSGRPGVVIGPRGGEVDKLREELEALTGRKVTVNVVEIKEPDLNATLVAEGIAEQLAKRASFRRTMKQFCEAAMNAGAKGVKIHLRRDVWPGPKWRAARRRRWAASRCIRWTPMWITARRPLVRLTGRSASRCGSTEASSAKCWSRPNEGSIGRRGGWDLAGLAKDGGRGAVAVRRTVDKADQVEESRGPRLGRNAGPWEPAEEGLKEVRYGDDAKESQIS